LDKVVETEKISETYVPWISDLMKSLIGIKENQKYIINNKFTYIKLCITVGIKHPVS